jgi:hypothetical protein
MYSHGVKQMDSLVRLQQHSILENLQVPPYNSLHEGTVTFSLFCVYNVMHRLPIPTPLLAMNIQGWVLYSLVG